MFSGGWDGSPTWGCSSLITVPPPGPVSWDLMSTEWSKLRHCFLYCILCLTLLYPHTSSPHSPPSGEPQEDCSDFPFLLSVWHPYSPEPTILSDVLSLRMKRMDLELNKSCCRRRSTRDYQTPMNKCYNSLNLTFFMFGWNASCALSTEMQIRSRWYYSIHNSVLTQVSVSNDQTDSISALPSLMTHCYHKDFPQAHESATPLIQGYMWCLPSQSIPTAYLETGSTWQTLVPAPSTNIRPLFTKNRDGQTSVRGRRNWEDFCGWQGC